MGELGSKYTDLSLKCDFPARESFREALLERLKGLDGCQSDHAAGLGGTFDEGLEPVELSDDELEMLAAAGSLPLDPAKRLF